MSQSQKPVLLVIEDADTTNWYELCREYADEFTVEQSRWNKIELVSYGDSKGANVTLYECENSKIPQQQTRRYITPSLVLIRNVCHTVSSSLDQVPDYRNLLYGFVHSCTPMINGFISTISDLERPIMHGLLRSIESKVGHETFPLITQYYYPDHQQMMIHPDVPFVLKISFPHAGYGKILVRDNHDFPDLASIVSIHKDYCVAEPFIDSSYELRIVFIAPNHYRAYKRVGTQWKVNFGPCIIEDIDMTPRWKKWVDLIFESYPDMETFAIDAIVDKEGKEYILEVNGSSHGLVPDHFEEDTNHLKDLVVSRIREIIGKKNESSKKVEDESDADTKIINLSNKIEEMEVKIKNKDNEIKRYKDIIIQYRNLEKEDKMDQLKIVMLIAFFAILAIVFIILYFRK
ncbi:Synapsin, ATP binding domain containing protein [Histomonas meleagridis]|uniref:Synapsin, ATP binding domain containing protein n=1 Tax=Histomonas meleagridis TaxID=135588 RepID=UPI00355ABB73|nr:Synapsin, ATP binding domain containing protein [Histomonas meleagridis]KAH0806526.1 Synapsin, ATP binding domain containing protein [Histomonas meleagridis]